jgi:putative ABC transport system ATP-binding protein
VAEKRLTTLMVTHNMHQAIRLGNRLVMMHRGGVILDVRGEEKQALSVEDLLRRFHSLRDGDGEADADAISDKMLLA